MRSEDKLSVVLPVTTHESRSSAHRLGWRTSPDEGAVDRTLTLLASFVKYFDQRDLLEFLIICPDDQVFTLLDVVAKVTTDTRYRVLSELNILKDLSSKLSASHSVSGWYLQQIIKLAASEHVTTPYYLTLDSDILCLKPFSYRSLFCQNRPFANTESPTDYQRLYTQRAAVKHVFQKLSVYKESAAIIGYDRPKEKRAIFFGETPVLLETMSVQEMLFDISQRSHQPWEVRLSNHLGWTEYGLYFLFLERSGILDSKYCLTGCNTILDLDRSIWEQSRNYRRPRSYNSEHFRSATGIFIAIQSWLPAQSWIPERHVKLNDFYGEVRGWLLS